MSLIFGVFQTTSYAANLGTYLNDNMIMYNNDWITSASGNHFLILQNDGNFCLYSGSSPSNNLGYVWCNGKNQPNSLQYFALIGDTGLFDIWVDGGSLLWECAFAPRPSTSSPIYTLQIYEPQSGNARVGIYNTTQWTFCSS